MKVNINLWQDVKQQIEEYTDRDENITDVTIKLRLKPDVKHRNYLQLNVTNETEPVKTDAFKTPSLKDTIIKNNLNINQQIKNLQKNNTI